MGHAAHQPATMYATAVHPAVNSGISAFITESPTASHTLLYPYPESPLRACSLSLPYHNPMISLPLLSSLFALRDFSAMISGTERAKCVAPSGIALATGAASGAGAGAGDASATACGIGTGFGIGFASGAGSAAGIGAARVVDAKRRRRREAEEVRR